MLIHQQEELGISRKDELPLDDGIYENFVIDPKAIKKLVVAAGPGATWQSI